MFSLCMIFVLRNLNDVNFGKIGNRIICAYFRKSVMCLGGCLFHDNVAYVFGLGAVEAYY